MTLNNLHAESAQSRARAVARKTASAAFSGAALLVSVPGAPQEPETGARDRQEEQGRPSGVFPNTFSVSMRAHVFPELPQTHSGYTSDFGMLARIRMGRDWGLVTGGSINAVSLLGSDGLDRTRVSSGDFQAGAYYQKGRHTVFGIIEGGFVRLETISSGPGLNQYYSADTPKAGGKAGYDYDRMVGLVVAGDVNPFNPLSLTMFGRSPYGWVEDARPSLSVGLGWLRIPDTTADGFFDTASISATLKVPLFKVGRFMPQAITIAEGDISSGKPNVYFGGTVQTDFKDGISLDAGAAESIRGTILLILSLSG